MISLNSGEEHKQINWAACNLWRNILQKCDITVSVQFMTHQTNLVLCRFMSCHIGEKDDAIFRGEKPFRGDRLLFTFVKINPGNGFSFLLLNLMYNVPKF